MSTVTLPFINTGSGDYTCTITTSPDIYGTPEHLKTVVLTDRVEITYRQTISYYSLSLTGDNTYSSSYRIYKEIYSIVDGTLQLTATVEGRHLPAREESYEFDE